MPPSRAWKSGVVEETHGSLDGRRREVHVPLRGLQIRVPGQLLDGARGGAAHRQVGAERAPLMPAPALAT